jgi:regulator of RNase E activity RraA
MVGVARTAVAEDDHLSVITALAGAGPDDVLVVTTNGHVRAVLGELLAHEAQPARAGGDRDRRHTAATSPACAASACRCSRAAPTRPPGRPSAARASARRSCAAAVAVSPGDLVVGDDDGIVIAPPARIAAALDAAEDRAVAEQAMLAAIRGGASYHDLSGFADHLARLDRGEDSRLEFRAHGG